MSGGHARLSAGPEARNGHAVRLTAGWRPGRPVTLAEHAALFGPLPDPDIIRRTLITAVGDAGLTGKGGGAFPTAVKMRAVAAGRRRAVVIANGMESEPASAKDQALLAASPHLVLDGAVLTALAVSADVVYLCLSEARSALAGHVRRAVEERMRAHPDLVPVEICLLPHRYVASEETALVRWLNGGEARPAFTPRRPQGRGVAGRPTLVDNVETLAHIALIARFGARWFRQAGSARAAGTTLVTLSGAVAAPGVYECEAGTPVADVLAVGGADQQSRAILVGGLSGTWHQVADIAALPLSVPGLQPAGCSPGAGVLALLPPGACGLTEAASHLRYLAAQSAQQCGPCMFGLPAVAADLAEVAGCQADSAALSRLERRLGQIAGRGACRHPDGAVRMAASALRTFADDARAHLHHRSCLAGRA